MLRSVASMHRDPSLSKLVGSELRPRWRGRSPTDVSFGPWWRIDGGTSPGRRERLAAVRNLVFLVAVFLVLRFVVDRSLPHRFLENNGRFEVGPFHRLRGARSPAHRIPFNASATMNHLIVVAGHAVTLVEDLSDVERSDRAWYLLSYQKRSDLPQAFVAHIKRGVQLAAKDPGALLVFSGGQTRRDAGPRSEAQSYFFIAEHFGWWGHEEVASRAATEEFARDSFENVLFGVARFREIRAYFPGHITVVSFAFKRRRFVDLHARALAWPRKAFAFHGIDPPARPHSRFDLEKAQRGERASALLPFTTDPYGCKAPLADKKLARDPFKRTAPYPYTCPEIQALLRYCGPAPFNGSLPWRPTAKEKRHHNNRRNRHAGTR